MKLTVHAKRCALLRIKHRETSSISRYTLATFSGATKEQSTRTILIAVPVKQLLGMGHHHRMLAAVIRGNGVYLVLL